MKFTENTLISYAAPLSKTEDEMCKHAIEMVRDALKSLGLTDDNKLITPLYEDTYSYAIEMRSTYGNRKVKIFLQGSYANNTNVRTQSDVDIAVVQEETFNTIFRENVTDQDYNFSTVPASSKSFKDEVEECLIKKFGDDVDRQDKSIKIHGNSYRKDADTVPCRRYRDYRQDYNFDTTNYIGGIIIFSDKGQTIINYPEQHIANGRKKNIETNHYYKKMVRIIKKMRYLMCDSYYDSAKQVSSFGLESLLWNIPNEIYTTYSIYRFAFGEVVDYLYNNIPSLVLYKEANGIKSLCPSVQDINKYEKYIKDLKSFYEYDI